MRTIVLWLACVLALASPPWAQAAPDDHAGAIGALAFAPSRIAGRLSAGWRRATILR